MLHLLGALSDALHREAGQYGSPLFNLLSVSPSSSAELAPSPPPEPATTQLTITIIMTMKDYTPSVEKWLRYGLAGFLETSPYNIQIHEDGPGSVKVTCQLPVPSAQTLIEAFRRSDPARTALPLPTGAPQHRAGASRIRTRVRSSCSGTDVCCPTATDRALLRVCLRSGPSYRQPLH